MGRGRGEGECELEKTMLTPLLLKDSCITSVCTIMFSDKSPSYDPSHIGMNRKSQRGSNGGGGGGGWGDGGGEAGRFVVLATTRKRCLEYSTFCETLY